MGLSECGWNVWEWGMGGEGRVVPRCSSAGGGWDEWMEVAEESSTVSGYQALVLGVYQPVKSVIPAWGLPTTAQCRSALGPCTRHADGQWNRDVRGSERMVGRLRLAVSLSARAIRIPGPVVEMKGGCWIPCSASTQCANGIPCQIPRSKIPGQLGLPDYFPFRFWPAPHWLLVLLDHIFRTYPYREIFIGHAFENIGIRTNTP